MTEERFEYNHMEGFKPYIYDINDNHMVDDLEIICELLNQLSNENEELKKEIVSLEVELDTHKHPLWSTRKAERVVNKLKKENEELKKEVEMLMNGLKVYDETLPLYLDCEDIMHFNNELFEFEMERMDFYKKYPNRIHYK